MTELSEKMIKSVNDTVDEMQCLGAEDIVYDMIRNIPELGKDAKKDKLFITELLNDLHKNGFVEGGKAETMLHDWGSELRGKSRFFFPASRIKKEHAEMFGKENW